MLRGFDFLATGHYARIEKDSNGNNTDVIIDYTYAIRYDEIIPINTYEIQKLKKRVAELEARIA
mgnify:CR=1 FL=1